MCSCEGPLKIPLSLIFLGFAVFIISVILHIVVSKDMQGFIKNMKPEDSPVEVTAVFINCEIDETTKDQNSENSRFEREELFKHNALQNCDKKLVLTIKLTSTSANSADEYVPIDHVVDGRNQRRVRLLDPYVLRLRRDVPLEAYKLRFIERDTKESSDVEDQRSEPETVIELGRTLLVAGAGLAELRDCAKDEFKKNWTAKRAKRHEKNVVIEEVGDESSSKNTNTKQTYENDKHRKLETEEKSLQFGFTKHDFSKGAGNVKNVHGNEKNELIRKVKDILIAGKKHENHRTQPIETAVIESDNIDDSEKEFALYEVGKPELWFKVHVNLFEKLSTPKGNTLWKDITKGESVSVSAMSPNWSDSDVTVHYKPVDFVQREDFLLPKTSICLLIPLVEDSLKAIPNTMTLGSLVLILSLADEKTNALDKDSNYILVPSKDVLNIENTSKSKRALANHSEDDTNERRRRVVVRVARALWDVMGGKLTVVNKGSDKHLTIVHRGKRRAQIDLEVRADDNQLVHVSAPGRIAIIVADNSRRARSTLTVQATNTGLFAGQFRAQIRECDSGLLGSEQQEHGLVSEPVLLPPRHTRRLRLQLTGPLPADLHHCSVYLLNGNDERVAVRDAVIKKDDQCFCVWHCDCVCLGEDPKLICKEMSAARQSAAGLRARRGARFTRACVYSDVKVVDVAVVAIGVIVMLLALGVLKGLLGLVWPQAGIWGLDWILEPRKLDCYYESHLRCRQVVYDGENWPVHPDTHKRTVRVVSRPVEFILNVVFFVVTPGLIVVDALKKITRRNMSSERCNKMKQPRTSKNIDSRKDVQQRGARARARWPRRSWMTPGAKELSEMIWTDPTLTGLDDTKCTFPLLCNNSRLPQLDPGLSSESESEQEDTAFVLMHMQKSTESLARNQINADAPDPCIDTVNAKVQQEQLARQVPTSQS